MIDNIENYLPISLNFSHLLYITPLPKYFGQPSRPECNHATRAKIPPTPPDKRPQQRINTPPIPTHDNHSLNNSLILCASRPVPKLTYTMYSVDSEWVSIHLGMPAPAWVQSRPCDHTTTPRRHYSLLTTHLQRTTGYATPTLRLSSVNPGLEHDPITRERDHVTPRTWQPNSPRHGWFVPFVLHRLP